MIWLLTVFTMCFVSLGPRRGSSLSSAVIYAPDKITSPINYGNNGPVRLLNLVAVWVQCRFSLDMPLPHINRYFVSLLQTSCPLHALLRVQANRSCHIPVDMDRVESSVPWNDTLTFVTLPTA